MPKEMKLIPKLRFPEFKDDGEWVTDTLNKVAEFRRGSFPQPYGLPEWYDDENGMPFIQVYDVDDNFRLKPTTKRRISELAAEQSVFIEEGTVIITIQGSIGRVAVTQYDAYIDRTLLIFQDYHKEIDKTFFAYILFLLFEIEKQKAPGGIIKTITKEVLSDFVISLPSIQEQQRIASCLSTLDALITAHNEKLAALKTHKKGLLQNLFPQKGQKMPTYRFPEFKDNGEWVTDTLNKVAEFRRGSFPQPYGLPEWYDDENGMPFIQVYDVDDNFRLKPTTKRRISELAAEQSVFIEEGTVIITIQGSIGRVAVTQYDAYIDRTLLIFQDYHKEIDKTFFAYILFLLFEIEKQKAPGGIIKTITKEVLSDFVISLPSIQEQQRIASCLSALDALITAQTDKIEKLQKHKKGLLQGLFPKIGR